MNNGIGEGWWYGWVVDSGDKVEVEVGLISFERDVKCYDKK